jgi:TonB family protein
MIARTACAGLALLSMVSSTLKASPREPLQALGPWALDYGETYCMAMRDYGTSDRPVTLAIIPAPDGETYELLFGRKHSGPLIAEELEGSVDFGSGPIKAWLLHHSDKNRKLDLYRYRIGAAEMSQARTAKAVTLHLKGGPATAFELAVMPALLEGLQKCTADLKDYWSIGHKLTAPVATPAKGDVRRVFTANDYPTEAVNRRQQGTARFLLLIDEKGAVAGCHVLKPSGVPILDAMGCAVIQERAKFTPARDSKGNPVRDSYVTPQITWALP